MKTTSTDDDDPVLRRLLRDAAASLPIGPPPPLERSLRTAAPSPRRPRLLVTAVAIPAIAAIAFALWLTRGPSPRHQVAATATPSSSSSSSARTLRDCVQMVSSQLVSPALDELLRLDQALGYNLDGPCNATPLPSGICGFSWTTDGWMVESNDAARGSAEEKQLRNAGLPVAGTGPCTPGVPLPGPPVSSSGYTPGSTSATPAPPPPIHN